MWLCVRVNIYGTSSIADDMRFILGGLREAVAAWGERGLMTRVLLFLAYGRLGKVARQFERLVARYEAGRLWRRAPGAVPAVRAAPAVVAAEPVPVGGVSQRQFGWLVTIMGWRANGYRSQLEFILQQPPMMALLRASPQAGRLLGPVCRMLLIAPELLRPAAEGALAVVVEAPAAKVKAPRKKRPPIDWGRIPLPRGVLTAARRAGFKPVR